MILWTAFMSMGGGRVIILPTGVFQEDHYFSHLFDLIIIMINLSTIIQKLTVKIQTVKESLIVQSFSKPAKDSPTVMLIKFISWSWISLFLLIYSPGWSFVYLFIYNYYLFPIGNMQQPTYCYRRFVFNVMHYVQKFFHAGGMVSRYEKASSVTSTFWLFISTWSQEWRSNSSLHS